MHEKVHSMRITMSHVQRSASEVHGSALSASVLRTRGVSKLVEGTVQATKCACRCRNGQRPEIAKAGCPTEQSPARVSDELLRKKRMTSFVDYVTGIACLDRICGSDGNVERELVNLEFKGGEHCPSQDN